VTSDPTHGIQIGHLRKMDESWTRFRKLFYKNGALDNSSERVWSFAFEALAMEKG